MPSVCAASEHRPAERLGRGGEKEAWAAFEERVPGYGEYYPRTIEQRFGGWPAVPEAFRKFAKGKREWADVAALLAAWAPNEKPLTARTNPQGCRLLSRQVRPALQHWPGKTGHATLRDRATYGNPIDFRGMRHEPVNEQGVVVLFGMLAKELGYVIEAVQMGFPDCEAKRQIGPGRWQRVRIEFEFESKNFHEHGHSLNGCDVIVCWRHNWEECPQHIEVLELSRIIKSLTDSKN